MVSIEDTRDTDKQAQSSLQGVIFCIISTENGLKLQLVP